MDEQQWRRANQSQHREHCQLKGKGQTCASSWRTSLGWQWQPKPTKRNNMKCTCTIAMQWVWADPTAKEGGAHTETRIHKCNQPTNHHHHNPKNSQKTSKNDPEKKERTHNKKQNTSKHVSFAGFQRWRQLPYPVYQPAFPKPCKLHANRIERCRFNWNYQKPRKRWKTTCNMSFLLRFQKWRWPLTPVSCLRAFRKRCQRRANRSKNVIFKGLSKSKKI